MSTSLEREINTILASDASFIAKKNGYYIDREFSPKERSIFFESLTQYAIKTLKKPKDYGLTEEALKQRISERVAVWFNENCKCSSEDEYIPFEQSYTIWDMAADIFKFLNSVSTSSSQ
ncbi:hypothetical protein [Candidatus Neptunochlamydia vexilliferae]|uniref:Uncharacterized protein n=1 Tax=Candidatus Neptunichlamydia vexilliferae TaxID=1651774 RepID=A0ABS0B1A0_9BACT|nr:hypothetical protein [Candidatus Neptunochlamydia vexilliferae]MBF5060183.1 hypothetical protein [Candidatus Neptunochlamydia vexilliferae]